MPLIILLIFIALIFGGLRMTGVTSPRGVRNKNPLNIEYNPANDWQGQTGSDGRFSIFQADKWGFRAAAKLIQNYQKFYGINTVQGIVNRWAPPHENETNNYADFVASQVGVSPTDTIDLTNRTTLTDVVHAMSTMEVGHGWYTREQAAEGVNLV